MSEDQSDTNALELATELTIAWLGNPNTRISADEVPAFLRRMHETVSELTGSSAETPSAEPQTEYTPAVSVRKSLSSRDHIISMIDGKPYKTLRRHLATHGLTPDQYRDRYGLKSDYPMVAESYSESRRAMAKQIGLGRKSTRGGGGEQAQPEQPAPTRGRKKVQPAGE
ncbi:MucR family transcriptional regulator [Sphingomonas lenta]|uniref:Transcriptional regulator n=1 Tax=Sphingomonas lenta TaxID=1141887 RepID=A0A2A2SFI3_9SPHN|nr:MucR family transcriptional regulator [Sphingomonas lenta]PAX07965.1 transcriptional regulator [Sphingomonas lenta]